MESYGWDQINFGEGEKSREMAFTEMRNYRHARGISAILSDNSSRITGFQDYFNSIPIGPQMLQM